LSGSTVEVKETLGRFTTDVIASCAFGINSNSLKDPDSEFGRHIRSVFIFSVKKGLAMLFAWFAPYLNHLFRLNFVENETNNYVRQSVWNTVEYSEKNVILVQFNENVVKTLCVQKFSSPTIYTLTVPPYTFYSIIREKGFQATHTTIFDKPLPSNVEVNNVSNFTAYYVGLHGVLLASEDF